MKKCTYCGKEYPVEEFVCAVDGQPLMDTAVKIPLQLSITFGKKHPNISITIKIMLCIVWVLLLMLSAWNLITGQAVNPLHPLNLLTCTALILGTLTVWNSSTAGKLISSACGIIVSLIMLYDFYIITHLFIGGFQFRTNFGPFTIEGVFAKIAFLFPPLLLLALSAMRIFLESLKVSEKQNII